jgi:hypothetical protein
MSHSLQWRALDHGFTPKGCIKTTYHRECHTLQIRWNLGIVASIYEMSKAALQFFDDPAGRKNKI